MEGVAPPTPHTHLQWQAGQATRPVYLLLLDPELPQEQKVDTCRGCIYISYLFFRAIQAPGDWPTSQLRTCRLTRLGSYVPAISCRSSVGLGNKRGPPAHIPWCGVPGRTASVLFPSPRQNFQSWA